MLCSAFLMYFLFIYQYYSVLILVTSKFEYFLGQLSAYYSPFKIFLGRGTLSTLKTIV